MGISIQAVHEEDLEDDEATLKWMDKVVPDGTWTLQEYVMRPALYGERKFDMRIWSAAAALQRGGHHLGTLSS